MDMEITILGEFVSPIYSEENCYVVLIEKNIHERYITCRPGLRSRGCYAHYPGWGEELCELWGFKLNANRKTEILEFIDKSKNDIEKKISTLLEEYIKITGIQCDRCKKFFFFTSLSKLNLHYNIQTNEIYCEKCYQTE